jgi:hypothetical protein
VGERAALRGPKNDVLAVESLKGNCSIREVFDERVVGREIVGIVQVGILAITPKEYLTAWFAVEELEHPRPARIAYRPWLGEEFAHWRRFGSCRSDSGPALAFRIEACPYSAGVVKEIMQAEWKRRHALWKG